MTLESPAHLHLPWTVGKTVLASFCWSAWKWKLWHDKKIVCCALNNFIFFKYFNLRCQICVWETKPLKSSKLSLEQCREEYPRWVWPQEKVIWRSALSIFIEQRLATTQVTLCYLSNIKWPVISLFLKCMKTAVSWRYYRRKKLLYLRFKWVLNLKYRFCN